VRVLYAMLTRLIREASHTNSAVVEGKGVVVNECQLSEQCEVLLIAVEFGGQIK